MMIRKAQLEDSIQILNLLRQVNLIHHNGRPDLFHVGTKYTPEQLAEMICDDNRPILVADEDGTIKGYSFCMIQMHEKDNILTDIKTLYLDDLCVDENCRGEHVGKALYQAVLTLARELGCYHVTLNVWCLNGDAMKFYEACGMKPLKICMEQIL